jgi:hypothetical protein
MTAPNVLSVTTIIGKTAVQSVGSSSLTTIVENTASSGKVIKINSLMVSNVDGTNNADITVDLYRSSTSYFIAKTITVPADATLVVISKENSIYLEEGDALRCQASADGDLQAVCSYEEIS